MQVGVGDLTLQLACGRHYLQQDKAALSRLPPQARPTNITLREYVYCTTHKSVSATVQCLQMCELSNWAVAASGV